MLIYLIMLSSLQHLKVQQLLIILLIQYMQVVQMQQINGITLYYQLSMKVHYLLVIIHQNQLMFQETLMQDIKFGQLMLKMLLTSLYQLMYHKSNLMFKIQLLLILFLSITITGFQVIPKKIQLMLLHHKLLEPSNYQPQKNSELALLYNQDYNSFYLSIDKLIPVLLIKLQHQDLLIKLPNSNMEFQYYLDLITNLTSVSY